jgi:hypothetical protein
LSDLLLHPPDKVAEAIQLDLLQRTLQALPAFLQSAQQPHDGLIHDFYRLLLSVEERPTFDLPERHVYEGEQVPAAVFRTTERAGVRFCRYPRDFSPSGRLD